jgi:CheY-like chemotaxis protein
MECSESGRLRALVVDDQRDSVYLLGKLLSVLDCEVTTCQVSDECIGHAHRMHPHLVLLDLAMPDKNGFMVAEELLSAELPPFYMVALTGYGGEKVENSCKAARFNRYLLKPTSLDELRQVVESARGMIQIG